MLRGNKIRRLEDDIIILEIISGKCLKEIEFLRDVVIERHKEKIERNSYRNYYNYEFKKSLLIELIDDVDMENEKCLFLKNNIVTHLFSSLFCLFWII
jgi:hypothetical protein